MGAAAAVSWGLTCFGRGTEGRTVVSRARRFSPKEYYCPGVLCGRYQFYMARREYFKTVSGGEGDFVVSIWGTAWGRGGQRADQGTTARDWETYGVTTDYAFSAVPRVNVASENNESPGCGARDIMPTV